MEELQECELSHLKFYRADLRCDIYVSDPPARIIAALWSVLARTEALYLEPFQDVVALCNELKLLVTFCRGERGQPNGQPVSVSEAAV